MYNKELIALIDEVFLPAEQALHILQALEQLHFDQNGDSLSYNDKLQMYGLWQTYKMGQTLLYIAREKVEAVLEVLDNACKNTEEEIVA